MQKSKLQIKIKNGLKILDFALSFLFLIFDFLF